MNSTPFRSPYRYPPSETIILSPPMNQPTMNQPVVAEAKTAPAGRIESAMYELAETVNSLEVAISDLVEAVNPVICLDDDRDGNQPAVEASCPLEMEIRVGAAELQKLTRRIISLNRRLCL